MDKAETLILGAQGAIMIGANVVVSKPEMAVEDVSFKEPGGEQHGEIGPRGEDSSQDTPNPHVRALVLRQKHRRYAWQQTIPSSEDSQEEERHSKTSGLYKKLSHHLKHRILQKACHQQFDFKDGYIVNSAIPGLALGVQRFNLHSGSEVIIVRKNSDDSHQKWLHKEKSRTFHLMSNPDLVLAVSMPAGTTDEVAETTSYPVIVQKYKPYKNGASNQKWLYMKKKKILKAFYSTKMDIDITIANHAGICTSSVAKEEEIDQLGYYFRSPGGKTKVMICLACARSMIGQKELKKLLPGVRFLCASGSKEEKALSLGAFKFIDVTQGYLSSYEAENTLKNFEELILAFRRGGSKQAISNDILTAMRQTPVKIIAHKNGLGSCNGKLIVAQSFPMLLSGCTVQLGLAKAASRLYTCDGTPILTLNDLILWAVNETFKHKDSEARKEVLPDKIKELTVQNVKGLRNPQLKCDGAELDDPEDTKTKQGETKSPPQIVAPSRLHSVNASLLSLILRNPIEVWVSCGEPFIPLDVLQRSEKTERENWLKKDRIMADLDIMKHKMRQLKGRRVLARKPAKIISTNSPSKPVIVKGGWMEPTQEERKLLEYIVNAKAQLSEVQNQQSRRFSPMLSQQRSLYIQPNTKRVSAYLNGQKRQAGVYAWGRSISEYVKYLGEDTTSLLYPHCSEQWIGTQQLLDDCSSRLRMTSPAKTLYTPDGKPLTSWDDIERDMLICVSSGNYFIHHKGGKHRVASRANSARTRRMRGTHSTGVATSAIERPQSKTNRSDSFLCLYTTPPFEGWERSSSSSKQMITTEKPFLKDE